MYLKYILRYVKYIEMYFFFRMGEDTCKMLLDLPCDLCIHFVCLVFSERTYCYYSKRYSLIKSEILLQSRWELAIMQGTNVIGECYSTSVFRKLCSFSSVECPEERWNSGTRKSHATECEQNEWRSLSPLVVEEKSVVMDTDH